MNLLEEYQNQIKWRNWEHYLSKIPIEKNDTVLDLGCSVGAVSNLFSKMAKKTIGIDANDEFIEYCKANQNENQSFYSGDLSNIKYNSFGEISGVWSSFTLSYLKDPKGLINTLFHLLPKNGWLALVDVSCFISGNMSPESKFLKEINSFEINSWKSGIYDFNFGAKMKNILEDTGFDILYFHDDVTDLELNFDGPAQKDVLENWQARLNRMAGLKALLKNRYHDFAHELIASLTAPGHSKNHNVQFVVAAKK